MTFRPIPRRAKLQGCYVYVTLPGATEAVVAGRLQISRSEAGETGGFVYGKSYLARADAVPIDPVELSQVADRAFTHAGGGGLFHAFRDAAPDSWGRTLIERSLGAAPDELGYLINATDDRAGALSFGNGPTPPAPRRAFDRHFDLEALQSAADVVIADKRLEDPELTEHVRRLMRHGTAMGGARPKAVVEHDGSLWLAKFSRLDDNVNIPCLEHATLTLARQCGLDVAESEIVDVAGRQVLLVKRFDRENSGSGWFRHRMVSALTVMQMSESDHGLWSYLDYADEVRRIGADHANELRELFKRITFNMLVNNNDDHPRNHAMISRGNTWVMSPAYDIVPKSEVTTDRRLAMSVGKAGRAATRSNLMTSYGRFLLSQADAASIIDDMIDTLINRWYPCCLEAGVSQADCQTIRSAFLNQGFDWDDKRLEANST